MTLRALALDHYFAQDLDAMESTCQVKMRRLPFEHLRQPALRMLGNDVASGLSAYNDPALSERRSRYGAWLRNEVIRLYREWPFHIVVLPSDSFFYVRPLPATTHAIGVPVVVVQKETTVSPDTLENHSALVKAEAPFMCDFMTVCSRRQREFWQRAGAPDALIEVTGQPRFDFYARVPRRGEGQNVLFLSYELDAYEPGVGGGLGRATWHALRSETEAVLLAKAKRREIDLVIKLHPQQSRLGETERLSTAADDAWNDSVRMADPEEDTRMLIAAADTVVGFQTTALYEAVAARRRVIYAAWGDAYEVARDGLIPFEDAPAGCVYRAGGPDELESLLSRPGAATERCVPWAEEALGPLDGRSAERVVAALHRIATRWSDAPKEIKPRVSHLAALRWLARAGVRELALASLMPVVALLNKELGAKARRGHAASERKLAQRELRLSAERNRFR